MKCRVGLPNSAERIWLFYSGCFTRSAINPPKVNRFEGNLEQCETNVGLALADFGRDSRSSDSSRRIVFPKKRKKLLTKFPGFANLNHISAMITDRRKFTAKWDV